MTPQSDTSTELPRQLRVFLCHASGDKPAVRDLCHRLRAAGFDPWLDEEKLLPGQDWQLEIPHAVRFSDAVVICLSRRAVTKAGYVQKEIRYALDVADEQPEGTIFLIPVRLEECEVPQRLRRWQWVDLFQGKGYELLLRALHARAKSLGLGRHPLEPEMILIPAGEFLLGSDPRKDEWAEDKEQPQHTLYLPDYYLAKTPVTNAQYAAFVQATFRKPQQYWEGANPPEGKEDHPVTRVSWYDAIAYCDWLAEETGKPYCLPSEAEWEKGARGTDGRIYPWGNEWETGLCNCCSVWDDTTSVGAHPQGASPYGLLDMAGNVREWTLSLYKGYPYDPRDGREDSKVNDVPVMRKTAFYLRTEEIRMLRGGAFYYEANQVRCAYRDGNVPLCHNDDTGFRLAVSPVPL